MKTWIILVILACAAFWFSPLRSYLFPPEIELDQYTIQKVEAFDFEARILSKKIYRHGREAKLSPVDFALGWGPMMDMNALEKIHVSQRNRWYYFTSEDSPIPVSEIQSHSANMHMIPATPRVHRQLLDAEEGDLIHLTGYLVNALANDGWRWKSSLSREDTGNGACEVVLVETFQAY